MDSSNLPKESPHSLKASQYRSQAEEVMSTKFWNDVMDKIKDALDRREKDCKTLSDQIRLYRAQGAAEALEAVLKFPQDVINNAKGV